MYGNLRDSASERPACSRSPATTMRSHPSAALPITRNCSITEARTSWRIVDHDGLRRLMSPRGTESFCTSGPMGTHSIPYDSTQPWKLGGTHRTARCPSACNSSARPKMGCTSPREPIVEISILFFLSSSCDDWRDSSRVVPGFDIVRAPSETSAAKHRHWRVYISKNSCQGQTVSVNRRLVQCIQLTKSRFYFPVTPLTFSNHCVCGRLVLVRHRLVRQRVRTFETGQYIPTRGRAFPTAPSRVSRREPATSR